MVLSQFREPPSAAKLLSAYNQFKKSKVSQATFKSWLAAIGFSFKRTTALVRTGESHVLNNPIYEPTSQRATKPSVSLEDDDDEDGSSAIIPDPLEEDSGGGFDAPPRMGGGNLEVGVKDVNTVLDL